ncbi:MAG: DUF1156 domain-containing protein [Chthonomonadetes bacterium]|nr:DUF1156 domain-containing protein [Chthonomonadetes bacterium]
MKKRLIEHALPVRELSAEAQREKAIRHGHISTLHVWWARRPLVTARAATFAALVDADAMDDIGFQKFLAHLCQWEVHDGNPVGRHLLEQARALIRQRFPDGAPKVLDPFAGGGSIPLEALRLGCEAHAVEYNPVAYLILRATIEYPQRYGSKLAEDVRRWGEWVLEQAREELREFYPPGPNGETVVAYIWSRTVRCPNPNCGAEIPLFRQFWLARKSGKGAALFPVPNREQGRVDFRVLSGRDLETAIKGGFDPAQGTVSRANARCLVCGGGAQDTYIRAEARAGRLGHRLVALVTTRGKGQGRNYHLARPEDETAFAEAAQRLDALKQTPSPWPNGLPWVPEEPARLVGAGQQQSIDASYGFLDWGKFFNPRQLLALVTFGKWVREATRRIAAETDPEYAKAVGTYLAFAVDFVANRGSILCFWDAQKEVFYQTFATHALKMAWDYAESNPLSTSIGSWHNAIMWLQEILVRESGTYAEGRSSLRSASSLHFEGSSVDAVITDPPYYDNVPYADLSDFFYVWLKRTVGDLYPEAFRTELTPKGEEAVVNPARFGGGKKGEEVARRHYERLMGESFREMHRVLKPDGVAVVMFTHRSTTAWESLIGSLLSAGLYPTASWAVHTEMEASTHQRGKGAVRSTILMACRKRPAGAGVGWYHQIRGELRHTVRERLDYFWEMGLRGADFFISAIGPAVGVFGRYEQVKRPDGSVVSVGDLLDEVRTLASDFALERLGRELGLVDTPTRVYVLWRWAYGGEELEFDEANKLSKSLGAELDELERTHGLVLGRGQTVALPDFRARLAHKVLSRPIQRILESGEWSRLSLIDALHLALWYWRRGERDKVAHLLALCGFEDENHRFWQVAQALYEVEREEKSLSEESLALGQMLPSQRTLIQEAEVRSAQQSQLRLFDEEEE